MKYILFLFFFFGAYSVCLATSWETVQLEKIIDNKRYRLLDQRIITPVGIDIPTFYDERKNFQCQARRTTRILQYLFDTESLRILEEPKKHAPSLYHIKIDTTNLTEFLLSKGLGKHQDNTTHRTNKTRYKKAGYIAEKKQIGIWSDCGKKDQKNPYQLQNLWGEQFCDQYAQYLAPISVGVVENVLSGDRIQLTNGLRVRLLGIQSPLPNDERSGFACFGALSQKYLAHLIAGKQVFLYRDIQDLNEDRELLRYVTLPAHNKTGDERFINKEMVQYGFAQSFWPDDIDIKHKDTFEKLQKEVYHSPTGAWSSCLSNLVRQEQDIHTPKEKPQKTPDPTCPIKGNISGSKKNPILKYHTVASGWYERLDAERCFETEEEALAAGFVKVK